MRRRIKYGLIWLLEEWIVPLFFLALIAMGIAALARLCS